MGGNPFETRVSDMRPPDLMELANWIYGVIGAGNVVNLCVDLMWLVPDVAENRFIYGLFRRKMSTDEILAMITRWELANVFPNSIDGDGFKLEDALRKAYGNEIRTHTALAKLRQQKNATETKLVRLELQLKEAEDESDFYADGKLVAAPPAQEVSPNPSGSGPREPQNKPNYKDIDQSSTETILEDLGRIIGLYMTFVSVQIRKEVQEADAFVPQDAGVHDKIHAVFEDLESILIAKMSINGHGEYQEGDDAAKYAYEYIRFLDDQLIYLEDFFAEHGHVSAADGGREFISNYTKSSTYTKYLVNKAKKLRGFAIECNKDFAGLMDKSEKKYNELRRDDSAESNGARDLLRDAYTSASEASKRTQALIRELDKFIKDQTNFVDVYQNITEPEKVERDFENLYAVEKDATNAAIKQAPFLVRRTFGIIKNFSASSLDRSANTVLAKREAEANARDEQEKAEEMELRRQEEETRKTEMDRKAEEARKLAHEAETLRANIELAEAGSKQHEQQKSGIVTGQSGTTENPAPSWEKFLEEYSAKYHELAEVMKRKIERFQATLEVDKTRYQAAGNRADAINQLDAIRYIENNTIPHMLGFTENHKIPQINKTTYEGADLKAKIKIIEDGIHDLNENYDKFAPILRTLEEVSRKKTYSEYVQKKLRQYAQNDKDFREFLVDYKDIASKNSERSRDFEIVKEQAGTHRLYAEYERKYNQREQYIMGMRLLYGQSINPMGNYQKTRNSIHTKKYKEWTRDYLDLSKQLDELKSKMVIGPGGHV